jgi:hypothetical protein
MKDQGFKEVLLTR